MKLYRLSFYRPSVSRPRLVWGVCGGPGFARESGRRSRLGGSARGSRPILISAFSMCPPSCPRSDRPPGAAAPGRVQRPPQGPPGARSGWMPTGDGVRQAGFPGELEYRVWTSPRSDESSLFDGHLRLSQGRLSPSGGMKKLGLAPTTIKYSPPPPRPCHGQAGPPIHVGCSGYFQENLRARVVKLPTMGP